MSERSADAYVVAVAVAALAMALEFSALHFWSSISRGGDLPRLLLASLVPALFMPIWIFPVAAVLGYLPFRVFMLVYGSIPAAWRRMAAMLFGVGMAFAGWCPLAAFDYNLVGLVMLSLPVGFSSGWAFHSVMVRPAQLVGAG